MDEELRTQLEAQAFRGLLEHLRERTDAQNIDIMNLAGFCRNCLSKWYLAAAKERGVEMDYEQAREVIYGEPYEQCAINIKKKPVPSRNPPSRKPNPCTPKSAVIRALSG